MVPKATPLPIAVIINEACLYRILVDVLKDIEVLPKAGDRPGKVPAAPNMAPFLINAIVAHRKHSKHPFHDAAELGRSLGADEKMEMIPHDYEVINLEVIFKPGPGKSF